MRKSLNKGKNINNNKYDNSSNNGFLPNSFKFISSCIKTVSSNVRSAGSSVASSLSSDRDELNKDQVLWACFDKLEINHSSVKHVLLLGYSNGFQVLDVEDASNVTEVVSRRDDPVTFLQMQPSPEKSEGREGFKMSHPLLLVIASDEMRSAGQLQNDRDASVEPLTGNSIHFPTAVRFYSLRSHNYVHVLRFRSTVYMVRCSSRIVAVGLATQIYCFDALSLENKFSVLTYPVPQLGGQGLLGINIGYGPMAVGPRWLAYASVNPLFSNTGRLSPQSLSPSPGVSPSTSPGSGSLVARYAMESSKQLAAGLINLGDMGYKTFSKYCHELLPDGSSSPVPANSSWKAGRVTAQSTEMDSSGLVVIKDFVSRAIVSQFRAHSSPISALCFDPSGTLLVTASIHGNNINIFRILPSSSQTGTGTHSFDWSSSHVHLYKLHRGMTSAVIQDICFSHYSQWIAIVSTRGTCHIFVLSPFGGETCLHMPNSHVNGTNLSPFLSTPWWSTSSFMINHSSPSPPAPVTLSVASRIKNVSFSWLTTVSNAASSATGKVSVPAGVVAAAFHCAVHPSLHPAVVHGNALEHLMVFTPSGHVIQYELLPCVGGDQVESQLRSGTASVAQVQEEELRVKVEALQWWDVCRRADWPEKEECISGINICKEDTAEMVMESSDFEDSESGEKEMVKPHDRSHWYLSNAEVPLSSGRVPVWQNSKIYFFRMVPVSEDPSLATVFSGEVDIERIPMREVEVMRKVLLPVFDHFQRIHADWTDGRGIGGSRNSTPSSIFDGRSDKFAEKPKIASPNSMENENNWSTKTPAATNNLVRMEIMRSYPTISQNMFGSVGPSSVLESALPRQRSFAAVNAAMPSKPSTTVASSLGENFVINNQSIPLCRSLSAASPVIAKEAQSPNSVITSEPSNPGSSRSDSSMNIIDEGPIHEDMQDPLDFGLYFQEEYCKASTHNEGCELTAAVADIRASNILCKEKSAEDGDSDGMLGGVFDFSEEG